MYTEAAGSRVQGEDGHVTAESAQPRKASNVTDPFPRERAGSGNFSRISWHFERFKSCDNHVF